MPAVQGLQPKPSVGTRRVFHVLMRTAATFRSNARQFSINLHGTNPTQMHENKIKESLKIKPVSLKYLDQYNELLRYVFQVTDRELEDEARRNDQVNLYATTPSGQQIKSSTFHLIGEDYNLALGINFDYTSLVYANRILVDLMSAEADLKSALWQGGDSALADLFDKCLAALGKPADALGKADRLKLVAMLEQKNAFSYRKSVPFVARRLGVSRYTVYKYLDEVTRQAGEPADG